MTVHINNPELEKQLEAFAKKTGQKKELLAEKLLEKSLRWQERYESERLDDEESIKEAISEGRYMQHDDVRKWLSTWGTEQEKECRPHIIFERLK